MFKEEEIIKIKDDHINRNNNNKNNNGIIIVRKNHQNVGNR